VFSFRASLAFVLTAAVFTSPAVAARAHRSAHSSRSHAAASAGQKPGRSSARSASARTEPTSDSSSSSSRKGRKSRASRVSSTSHRLHGQQGIDSSRATEIQQALIREHYLDGEPTGQWDSATQAAMQKYQAAQGWQTKLMPDSRALVKLGLGPDYSDAINAKTGNFAPPPPVSSIPTATVAGFAAGSHAATADNTAMNR